MNGKSEKQMETVRVSTLDDLDGWLALAREVEPIFGPMADEAAFRTGLKEAILVNNAFCVTRQAGDGRSLFRGGIVVSKEANSILWLAVSRKNRGQGVGKALLAKAVGSLDRRRPIAVTTFYETEEVGLPARRLYLSFGFKDDVPAGVNPAGIPTVTMVLAPEG